MRRAVFLDRDGVLNRSFVRDGKPYAPRVAKDFRLLPGVKDAVARLKAAGYLIIVVTNQPDVGNGLMPRSELVAMHERLRRRLPIDDIRACEHRQDAGCACRKPRPGMLVDAARLLGVDLRKSIMIGDRTGDVIAGQAVGCYTVFINRRYREPAPVSPDLTANSLPHAVHQILAKFAS